MSDSKFGVANVGLIYGLINKIMAELPVIGKEGKNSAQNYSFRRIEDMYNVIQPLLVKHCVFCAPRVLERESTERVYKNAKGEERASFRVLLTVAHRFYAIDGSFVEVITSGEGMDTSDKSSNKAMSSAMKYAFIELFSIPTEDIADSDKDDPEAGTAAPHVIRKVTSVNSDQFGL